VLMKCIVTCPFQVVPLMFVVIAMLGEKLRQLSKNAQTSVAGISTYLNEVCGNCIGTCVIKLSIRTV
jgi:hypothetical protein